VGHASRSSGLLRVGASLARVSQSSLKTVRDATTGGARGTIMEVASEEDRRVDATDYVRLCYPTFTIFNVLGPRGIVII
jgi:hypothetical protein